MSFLTRRRCARACAVIAGVAAVWLGAYVQWLRTHAYPPGLPQSMIEHGIVAAPDWFVPALRASPRRRLSASEREAFRRDGAVLIKGLLPDRNITQHLSDVLGDVKASPANDWWINDVLHSLIKHGPMAELSASALDVPEVTIWNLQLEPRPGKAERTWPLREKPWYDDMYGHPGDQGAHEDTDQLVGHLHKAGHFVKPMASIYLALTDLPHGLELLKGSHVANQRHGCRRHMQGPVEFKACMDRLERDCHGVAWWDLAPGDVIVFYGSLLHWSVLQEKPRKALSVRYVPADMMYTGFVQHYGLASYVNWKCGPIGGCPAYPIFYSNDSSRMKEQPWPLWGFNKDTSPVVARLRRLLWHLDIRCGLIFDL